MNAQKLFEHSNQKIVFLRNVFFLVCTLVLTIPNLNAQNKTYYLNGGYISTKNDTNICVDGTPDYINVDLTNAQGYFQQWVITDAEQNILALPQSPPFEFDGAGAGVCQIWHLSYAFLFNLNVGVNLNDLYGWYDLSNSIEVVRTQPDGGTLEGGPFYFTVGDGEADNIPEGAITVSGGSGSNSQWVVTDDLGNILGLPPSPYVVDFDGAGPGTCLVWYLRFEDGLTGAEVGNNASDLKGCFSLSNPIEVVRTPFVDGGKLEGGPFEFCVGDEVADNIMEGAITLSENVGSNSQWVITDDQGNILGLPPSPYVVNFDGAGPGTCLVWHLSFEDGLEGAEVGNNAATDLVGNYDLSNPIEVVRTQPDGGTLEGGPFYFTVGDGEADNIPEGAITVSGGSGSNSQWVVTDDLGNILGLPPSPYVVDFDGAGPGTCLVWYLRFEDGLTGAEVGNNASDLKGCFSLSNPIEVIRTEQTKPCKIDGGKLTSDDYYVFCVGDKEPDYATGIVLTGNGGGDSQWIVTDLNGTILGLPPSPDAVNFDGAGEGICLVWHLSYQDDLVGLAEGNNAFEDLTGCFDLSNPIPVFRFDSEGLLCELFDYSLEPTNVKISMYPNPTTDKVNIDFEEIEDEVSVKIYSLNNEEVFQRNQIDTHLDKKLEVNTSNLTTGFYLVSITDSSGNIIAVKRLIIK